MSRAFRNQISTIAALDGFTNMLVDLIKEGNIYLRNEDGSENKDHPDWDTPLKTALVEVKRKSRLAQMQCKGQLTNEDAKRIFKAIDDNAIHFKTGSENKLMDIVSFTSFALIGLDNVVHSLKAVKPKLLNKAKIKAFEELAQAGFDLLRFFDPELDSINSYVKADLARKHWEEIFEI